MTTWNPIIYQTLEAIITQTRMIVPYWLSGIIIGSLLITTKDSWITVVSKKLESNEKSYILQISLASILGAASPITLHGVIPVIAALGTKKIPEYILISFIVTSVLINPNLVVFSFALGYGIALTRLLLTLIAGILAGLIVKFLYKNAKYLDIEGFERKDKYNQTVKSKVKVFLSSLKGNFRKTGKNLMIGIILTALIDGFLPREVFFFIFSRNKALAVLFSASIGVPLYYCGGGTIPLLRLWLENGMSLGAGFAFMLAGPATKINNLAALKNVVKLKEFVLYIIFSLGFAIAAGLIIDVIIL